MPTGRARLAVAAERVGAQTTMFKRIAAIVFIFGCTAVAWAILGSTIFYRTYNAESGLSGRVASTWGAQQAQAPPSIAREWKEEKTVEVEEKGKKTTRTERQTHSETVKIDASRVAAALHIDYRQKGCCGSARIRWISTERTRSRIPCRGKRSL